MISVTATVKQYDEIASDYAHKISNRIPTEALQVFEKYVPKGSTVLDVGCVAGRDSRELAARGYKVTGIDLSEKLLDIAKKENPTLPFFHQDMRQLLFEAGSFNAIWACAVFQHLDQREMIPTLKEFYRVLSDGGVLFIRTKRGVGTWRVSEALASNKEREFSLVSSEQLDKMLSNVGFIQKELYENKSADREVWWVNALYAKV